MPWPARWPTYSPAIKHANFLESYADALDLKIWTKSKVINAKQDPMTNEWTIQVRKRDEESQVRTLKAKHIIMATGFAGRPKIPNLPGMDSYLGEVKHASKYYSGKGYEGKRILVVGAGASGLDIALDACEFSRYLIVLANR